MVAPDFRAEMTLDEFAAIPFDPEYLTEGYWPRLIFENHRFMYVANRCKERVAWMRVVLQLNPAQQTLYFISVFDDQVRNGGITQFFWNNPEYAFEVRDAVERLGDAEALTLFERALDVLGEKFGGWSALRDEFRAAGANPDWETFRKSYDLLDLKWFDEGYFDRYGYDSNRAWVVQGHGSRHALMTRLAEYVRSHPLEYITG